MGKIAIIGAGQTRDEAIARLKELGETDVLVMTPEEYAASYPEATYDYVRSYTEHPPVIYTVGQKPFKCKGKHQYREQGGSWVCECGRKL